MRSRRLPEARWVVKTYPFALALFLAACVSLISNGSLRATPSKILLIGDSLTKPVPGRHSPPLTRIYSVDLAERMGRNYRIVNLAEPGSTAVGWKNELFMRHGRPKHPADVVIFLVGSNDASGLYGAPLSARHYLATMTWLVEHSLKLGAGKVMLIPPPNQNRKKNRAQVTERLGRYRDVITRLCERNERVVCGPDLFSMLGPREHLGPDNVHLNQAGHNAISGLIYRALKNLEEATTAPDEDLSVETRERGSIQDFEEALEKALME